MGARTALTARQTHTALIDGDLCRRIAIAVLSIMFCAGAPAGLSPARAGQQSPALKPVAKALDEMGDDFCKSFKLKCPAKTRRTPKAAEKPRARHIEHTAKPVPKPAEKPKQVSPAQAGNAPETTPAPTPKLRPTPPPPDQPKLPKDVAKAPPAPPPPTPKPLEPNSPEPNPVENGGASSPSRSAEAPKPAEPPTPTPAPPAPAAPPVPVLKPAETPAAATSTPEPPADDGCLAQLKRAGIGFVTAQQASDKPNCHIDTPVEMFSVTAAGGSIALPERPLLKCKFALQLSLWLTDAAAPGVAAKEKSRLAKVATGPGYDCRGRNGDTTAKISEHASGNAVDITTFTLEDGTAIQVASAIDASAASYPLLRGLRTTACGYFSTVLGPGANAAHATHFHFDMGLHGKSASYKICE